MFLERGDPTIASRKDDRVLAHRLYASLWTSCPRKPMQQIDDDHILPMSTRANGGIPVVR